MAEHKHGDMNIETQERTFEGFVRAVAWCAVVSIAALIFIALINA